ncbi:MAG TPA: trypsin-like peptidase domain-containing protein, partial [Fusibacter sp.]|nr:trypsin-like peptidase domain-containing protein [Fusibacter sp.]
MDENERKDKQTDLLTNNDTDDTDYFSEDVKEEVVNDEVENISENESEIEADIDSGASENESIEISEEHVEAVVVPVRKSGKIKMSTVLMVLLSVVLIGGSAYTIGYYNGQINLNDADINERVEALLESNYKSEIYKSVKEYIDESGINSSISEADVTEIFKNVSNSIVGITSKTYIYDWFNSQQESQVTGSGVIFDQTPELFYVVTNYHVISDATDVIVEIAKDQIVNSKVVGFDESTDLAVLAIEKKDINADLLKEIKPIAIGDSEKIQIGEIAIAIGNPLGYNNTVTQGIISAVDRQVDEDTNVMYIQTDAAINPGNSGGALVNSKGELIGINSAKIAETDVEGMGFAIPTEKMMTIVSELMENGYVSRPYIGIGGVDIDESTAKLYDIPM